MEDREMRHFITFIVAVLAICASVRGAVVQTFTDKNAWFSAADQVTTIDFTGHPNGSPVLPEHYAHLGVTFTGQQLVHWHTGFFQNDGEGIIANNNTLFAHFDEPQRAIAVDYPGGIRFKLYMGDTLLYTSGSFFAGFTGLISDRAFDRVELFRNPISEFVFIDDLHFSAIPAPGALALLGLAALGWCPRRRS